MLGWDTCPIIVHTRYTMARDRKIYPMASVIYQMFARITIAYHNEK